jgi:hypothetical protein
VGGFLDLQYTKIKELPQGLIVGKYMDITGTPISEKYTEEEVRRMVPSVGSVFWMKSK